MCSVTQKPQMLETGMVELKQHQVSVCLDIAESYRLEQIRFCWLRKQLWERTLEPDMAVGLNTGDWGRYFELLVKLSYHGTY